MNFIQLQRSTYILSFLLLALASVGCGGVHADKQENSEMKKPDFQIAEQGFFLADGAFDKEFTGSVIIWSKNPSIDGVGNVVKVSSELIRNGVKQLQYLDSQVLPLKAEFEKLLPTAIEKQTSIVTKTYEPALKAAATWLAGPENTSGEVGKIAYRLKMIYKEDFTDDDKKMLFSNFTLYCEAKIWERATKANLVLEEYRGRRPTPSGMCEGIYQKFGLLSTSSPACSATKEYKNYFPCLWREGVKKTKLWRARYPEGSAVAKAFDSLSDQSLKNFFSKLNGKSFLEQKASIVITDLDRGSKVKIPLEFNSAESGLMGQSVSRIITNIEGNPITDDDATRFFRQTGRSVEAVAFLDQAEKALRDNIADFNRVSADNYVNENRFNAIFQKPSKVAQEIKDSFKSERRAQIAAQFPSIFVIALPEVDKLKAELVPIMAKLKEIGETALQRSQEVGKPTVCKSPTQSLGCEYNYLAEKAQDVVMPNDVSSAVWQSYVRLNKSPDGSLLLAEVKINQIGSYVSKACTKIDETSSAKCPEGTDGGALSFDADTGNVTLTIPVADVVKQALQESKRSDFKANLSFSEIPDAQLNNAKIVYSATLSLVDKILLTLIGDVSIVTEDKDGKNIPWAYGAIKLREKIPYQQAQAEAFKAALLNLQASGM